MTIIGTICCAGKFEVPTFAEGIVRREEKGSAKNFQNSRNFFLVESQNSYLCNPKNDKPSGENVEKEKDR